MQKKMRMTTDSNSSKSRLPFIRCEKDKVLLRLYIQPRASKSEIAGVHDGRALKLRIASPPVEGAANSACIEFFADTLGIRKSLIEISSGMRSRIKQIAITGMSLKDVEDRLNKLLH